MINIFAKIQHFLHIFPLYNDEDLVVLLSISSPKKQKKKSFVVNIVLGIVVIV